MPRPTASRYRRTGLALALGLLALLAGHTASAVEADERAAWLELARRGWNYRLREPPLGRDMTIPVRISSRTLEGAALCLVGERPRTETRAVIESFRALIAETTGRALPMRYAGETARDCGTGRVVVLRLYSGDPPDRALTADLTWLDEAYGLGLPEGRDYAAMSPAVAQTFFGRWGQAVHVMVQQAPPERRTDVLEDAFFRSILIEELFQVFTFGTDILVARRDTVFQSKLQELPVRMSRYGWETSAFMQTLLTVSPGGLCRFDIFMLHAVAEAPVRETTDPAFLDYIDAHFEELRAKADATRSDPEFGLLLDPACGRE